MGILTTSSRVQLMVCSVCVTVTVLMIYSHLLLVDEIHNLTFPTVVLSADEGVRISFACVLAGAASLVLDYVLDLASVLAGKSKGTPDRLFSRVMVLFVVFWPSLRVFLTSGHLDNANLLTDGLMQRYVGMILIVDFLQTLESENRWSSYLVIGIIGSLSVAIVLFYLRVHFRLSFSYFLA
jgi:hypothetical protein